GDAGHVLSSDGGAVKNQEKLDAVAASGRKTPNIAIMAGGAEGHIRSVAAGTSGRHSGAGLPERRRDVSAYSPTRTGHLEGRVGVGDGGLVPGALGNIAESGPR